MKKFIILLMLVINSAVMAGCVNFDSDVDDVIVEKSELTKYIDKKLDENKVLTLDVQGAAINKLGDEKFVIVAVVVDGKTKIIQLDISSEKVIGWPKQGDALYYVDGNKPFDNVENDNKIRQHITIEKNGIHKINYRYVYGKYKCKLYVKEMQVIENKK